MEWTWLGLGVVFVVCQGIGTWSGYTTCRTTCRLIKEQMKAIQESL